MELSFRLDVFEGPMDLLLHLISKHKLNINDIPIFELVEQYIGCVKEMQRQDMEIASEFLEMAARLVYIKTVSLLPSPEEAEELKRELTGQLLEYRDCKIMAGKLSQIAKGFDYFGRPPMPLPKDFKYKRTHSTDELLEKYIEAVGRGQRNLPANEEVFKPLVSKKIVSVASKIVFLLRRLWSGHKLEFNELFEKCSSKSEMVAIFLAVLELSKVSRINIENDDGKTQLIINKGDRV